MPYVHIVIAVVFALAVATTFFPVRRDPVTGLAFVTGWLTGELAGQYFIVYSAVVIFFYEFQGDRGYVGRIARVLDVVILVGLAVLFIIGCFARNVVHRALASTPGLPIDVRAVAGVAAWSRWWRSLFAIPLPGRRLEVIKDVAYGDDHLAAHRLDVIRPREAVSGAPVLVYVHGGAWVIGDKREQGKPMMYELASRGWVCVSINYRLSPSATWPDHVVDVLAAVAWVKDHIAEYGGDPSFVALSGGSAGGHLCALAGLAAGDPTFQPGFEQADTSVQACVPLYGVLDMTASKNVGGRYGPGLRVLLERQVMKVSMSQDPELFQQASPLHRIHRDAPPYLVLHGTHDTLVPIVVPRTFVERLRMISTSPVAYIELPIAQHAFDVLASPRCTATNLGIVAFLETIHSRHVDRGAQDTTDTISANEIELWSRAVLEVTTDAGIVDPREVARDKGEAVYLVTAYNPDGTGQSEAANREAADRLEGELARREIARLVAVGRDEEAAWVEPGWCLWGISRSDAVALGASYGQKAIYEVTADAVRIVMCDGSDPVEVTDNR